MISAWNDNTGRAKAKHPYRKCLVWKSESTNLENGGSFLLRLATPPPLISAHENNRDLKSPANTSASNRAKNDFIGLKFSLHVWQNRTSCTIKGNCLRKEKTIWTRKSNFVLKINHFFWLFGSETVKKNRSKSRGGTLIFNTSWWINRPHRAVGFYWSAT